MIDSLKNWICSIALLSLFLSLAELFISQKSIKRVLRTVGGILILVALFQPFQKIAATSKDVFGTLAVQSLEKELLSQREEQLAALIEKEITAYIWDKTEQLGVSCAVVVEVDMGPEGLPVLKEVRLATAYNEDLSCWLEEELGVKKNGQIWQEES